MSADPIRQSAVYRALEATIEFIEEGGPLPASLLFKARAALAAGGDTDGR